MINKKKGNAVWVTAGKGSTTVVHHPTSQQIANKAVIHISKEALTSRKNRNHYKQTGTYYAWVTAEKGSTTIVDHPMPQQIANKTVIRITKKGLMKESSARRLASSFSMGIYLLLTLFS